MIEFETGIVQVLAACAALGRPFFVGGSVAAMAYGEPRATADVDVVIDATGADAAAILRAFPEADWHSTTSRSFRFVRRDRRGVRGGEGAKPLDKKRTARSSRNNGRSPPARPACVPPSEVLSRELGRGAKGSFNLLHHATGLKVDVYPAGGEALNRYGLERARSIDAFGVAMPIAPPEYVVAMKLRWWSISHQDKHLRDIRGMLATSPGQLPDDLVLPWLDAEQRTAWDDCRLRAGEE